MLLGLFIYKFIIVTFRITYFIFGRYEGRREEEIRGRIRSDEEEAQGT